MNRLRTLSVKRLFSYGIGMGLLLCIVNLGILGASVWVIVAVLRSFGIV